ncbi:MAG: folate-binding protein YgfZ [Acidobacteriales bacterium]|nr:folate-binding protein YgfZ [Terriglobales bacterium]
MTLAAIPDNQVAPPSPDAVTNPDRRYFRAQFAAFLTGAAIYDLSGRAKLNVTGGDRVRWLNGMVTNNIRDLAPGRGVYAFLLNPQGRILGDLYAYNQGEFFLLDTDKSQLLEKITGIFEHYIIMDDVEVSDASAEVSTVGIAGPDSKEVMRTAGLTVPEELPPLGISEVAGLANGEITVVRNDNPSIEGYEFWMAPKKRDEVWNALLQAGAIPAEAEALESLRVASGIPRYGQDIRDRDLPQETEQHRALHFTKGCYIGQEIVERIRSRGNVHRKFAGFEVGRALPAPPPGARIKIDGKEIGELTSIANVPLASGDQTIALGYIRREFSAPGTEVTMDGGSAVVINLPMADIFKH